MILMKKINMTMILMTIRKMEGLRRRRKMKGLRRRKKKKKTMMKRRTTMMRTLVFREKTLEIKHKGFWERKQLQEEKFLVLMKEVLD